MLVLLYLRLGNSCCDASYSNKVESTVREKNLSPIVKWGGGFIAVIVGLSALGLLYKSSRTAATQEAPVAVNPPVSANSSAAKIRFWKFDQDTDAAYYSSEPMQVGKVLSVVNVEEHLTPIRGENGSMAKSVASQIAVICESNTMSIQSQIFRAGSLLTGETVGSVRGDPNDPSFMFHPPEGTRGSTLVNLLCRYDAQGRAEALRKTGSTEVFIPEEVVAGEKQLAPKQGPTTNAPAAASNPPYDLNAVKAKIEEMQPSDVNKAKQSAAAMRERAVRAIQSAQSKNPGCQASASHIERQLVSADQYLEQRYQGVLRSNSEQAKIDVFREAAHMYKPFADSLEKMGCAGTR